MTGKESGHIDHEAAQAVPHANPDTLEVAPGTAHEQARRLDPPTRHRRRNPHRPRKSLRLPRRRNHHPQRRIENRRLSLRPPHRCHAERLRSPPLSEKLERKDLHLLRRHRRPGLHRTRHRRRKKLGSLDEEIRPEESRRRNQHSPGARTLRLIFTHLSSLSEGSPKDAPSQPDAPPAPLWSECLRDSMLYRARLRSHPKTQPPHQLLDLVLTPPDKRKRNRIPARQHHQRRLPHHPRPNILLKISPHHRLSSRPRTHKALRPPRTPAPSRLPLPDRNTAPHPSTPDTTPRSPPQSESKHSHPPPAPPAAAKTPPAALVQAGVRSIIRSSTCCPPLLEFTPPAHSSPRSATPTLPESCRQIQTRSCGTLHR